MWYWVFTVESSETYIKITANGDVPLNKNSNNEKKKMFLGNLVPGIFVVRVGCPTSLED